MFQITKRKCRIAEIILLVLVLLSVLSCNSRIEGCLDVAAENFDLDADKRCNNCCRYPSVTLILTQLWGDHNFQISDTFYDINQKPFIINDLKYMLSSFSWEDADDKIYTIDSSIIGCNEQQIGYTRDLLQIDSRTFTYPLDTIRLFPHIQQLNWKVGWPSELQCVDETSDEIPVVFQYTNPLWDASAGQRAAIRVVVQRNLDIPTLDTIFIHTCRQLQLPYDFAMPVGVDGKFYLTVDYAKWFMSVNVLDPFSFVTSIPENLDGSFSRTQ